MKSKNLILSAMLMALPSTLMAQQNIQKAFDALLKDKIVETDRKSTRLNSSHIATSRMPSSA